MKKLLLLVLTACQPAPVAHPKPPQSYRVPVVVVSSGVHGITYTFKPSPQVIRVEWVGKRFSTDGNASGVLVLTKAWDTVAYVTTTTKPLPGSPPWQFVVLEASGPNYLPVSPAVVTVVMGKP